MSTVRACKRCNRAHITSEHGVEVVCADSWHAVVRWPGGEAPVTPQEGRLLGRLLARSGNTISKPDLIDWLWGDRADGGPEGAPEMVRIYIHRLRRRLAAAGFPGRIDVHWRLGVQLVMEVAP